MPAKSNFNFISLRVGHPVVSTSSSLSRVPHRAMTVSDSMVQNSLAETKGAFFWDYSGIGILGIDGICVLLGAILFSE